MYVFKLKLMLVVVVGLTAAHRARTKSCIRRCDALYDSRLPCQCDNNCIKYGDCCPDYDKLCDRDFKQVNLTTIADILWNADADRASSQEVRYSLQGNTTLSSKSDQAANCLFAYVSRNLFSRSIYYRFLRLLNNYNRNTKQREYLSWWERWETEKFLNVVVSSGPMKEAAKYLCAKGLVQCNNRRAMKNKLRSLWFELYPRSGKPGSVVDSSGFEHVFVGETKPTSVTGFHNWVQFYLQERRGVLDYKGYISKREPVALNTQLTWHGLRKKQASFFIRTSPAFDMALYTVCILEKPGRKCHVNVQGQAITIQTYDVGHKPGLQVASAFAAI